MPKGIYVHKLGHGKGRTWKVKDTSKMVLWQKGHLMFEGAGFAEGNQFRKGMIPWNKGKKGLQVSWAKGKKRPEMSGDKHPGWKGGGVRYIIKQAPRPKPIACEVCGKERRIVCDHDHKTNKFRGWICSPCNSVLGFVSESQETLIKLANYLKNDGTI